MGFGSTDRKDDEVENRDGKGADEPDSLVTEGSNVLGYALVVVVCRGRKLKLVKGLAGVGTRISNRSSSPRITMPKTNMCKRIRERRAGKLAWKSSCQDIC